MKLRISFRAIVENVAVPVGVITLARVCMLVQVRTIEEPEPMLVVGEMGRHPNQNDSGFPGDADGRSDT